MEQKIAEFQTKYRAIEDEVDKLASTTAPKVKGGIVTNNKRRIIEQLEERYPGFGHTPGFATPLVGDFALGLVFDFTRGEEVHGTSELLIRVEEEFQPLEIMEARIKSEYTIPNKYFLLIHDADSLIFLIKCVIMSTENPIVKTVSTLVKVEIPVEREEFIPAETDPRIQQFFNEIEAMKEVPSNIVEELKKQIKRKVAPDGLIRYYTEDGTLLAKGRTLAEADDALSRKLAIIKQKEGEKIVRIDVKGTESKDIPITLLGTLFQIQSGGRLERQGSEEVLYTLSQMEKEGFTSESISKFAERLLTKKKISKSRINMILPKTIEEYKSIYEYYQKKFKTR